MCCSTTRIPISGRQHHGDLGATTRRRVGAQFRFLAVELLEPRPRVGETETEARAGRAFVANPGPSSRTVTCSASPMRLRADVDHAGAWRVAPCRGGSHSPRSAAAPCAARPHRAARNPRRCRRAAGPRTAAARWIDTACRYSSSRPSVTSCASMSASTARSRSENRASVSSACWPFCWRTSTTMAFSVLNRKCGCSCALSAPRRACATCVSSCEARRSDAQRRLRALLEARVVADRGLDGEHHPVRHDRRYGSRR